MEEKLIRLISNRLDRTPLEVQYSKETNACYFKLNLRSDIGDSLINSWFEIISVNTFSGYIQVLCVVRPHELNLMMDDYDNN